MRLYTLSSCAWCGRVKDLLNRLGVRYQYVDTDLLEEQEQDEIVTFLDSITEKWGFPVLLIHDKYLICGYKEKATKDLEEKKLKAQGNGEKDIADYLDIMKY